MPVPSDRPCDARHTDARHDAEYRLLPRLAPPAGAGPDVLPVDAVRRRRALELVADALAAVPLSLEAVRAAAVRYGLAARDAGLGLDDMAAALAAQVRRAAGRFGAAQVAQLGASVAWWGAHGYHRAD